MVSPILNEDWILDLLKTAPGPNAEAIARIQAGTLQALLDLYDRKVTRTEFVTSAAAIVDLYATTAKLGLMGRVEGVYHKDLLNQTAFDEAMAALETLVGKQADAVSGIIELVSKCAPDAEPIH